MDIDQQGDVIEPESGGQIILPSEAHPGIIHVLPYERPFFPGQAIPLVVDAETWLPTLKEIQKREQDVIGLLTFADRRIDQLGQVDIAVPKPRHGLVEPRLPFDRVVAVAAVRERPRQRVQGLASGP